MADTVKDHVHEDLRQLRAVLLWKLEGLSEYDVRRPLTATGTNLLGLVKHLAIWESRYFGEVFGRPFPEPLPRWDDAAADDAAAEGADMCATVHETREEIIDLYRRVAEHSDATIVTLDADSPGQVPWWGQAPVTLFAILTHLLIETSRHVGHADILREQLDGSTGYGRRARNAAQDVAFWQSRRAEIERAARTAASASTEASAP